jgi:hypothetical protein
MRKKGCKGGEHHGMSHTRLYKVWCDMRARCENKNQTFYHNYGGRDEELVMPPYHYMKIANSRRAKLYNHRG